MTDEVEQEEDEGTEENSGNAATFVGHVLLSLAAHVHLSDNTGNTMQSSVDGQSTDVHVRLDVDVEDGGGGGDTVAPCVRDEWTKVTDDYPTRRLHLQRLLFEQQTAALLSLHRFPPWTVNLVSASQSFAMLYFGSLNLNKATSDTFHSKTSYSAHRTFVLGWIRKHQVAQRQCAVEGEKDSQFDQP